LLSFLPILPRDSTLAFEPNAGMQCTLNLFTDEEWHTGQYILIGIAYDQQGASLAQKFIELT